MQERYQLKESELHEFFLQKYGNPETTGWSPRRRFNFGYYLAGDRYEALVAKLVNSKTVWIDVGGGSALFPSNTKLSEELSNRCHHLTAVDPSENILDNPYCDENAMCFFEDYKAERKYNLATFRMVAEHVDNPNAVLENLDKLIEPGGLVVIYTINKYCPVPIVTKLTPFSTHHKLKSFLRWGGDEKDTFPVAYKMNTRNTLQKLFNSHNFDEDYFEYADDLSVFLKFNSLSYIELLLWKFLKLFNVRYPEHNLLGVYKKRS